MEPFPRRNKRLPRSPFRLQLPEITDPSTLPHRRYTPSNLLLMFNNLGNNKSVSQASLAGLEEGELLVLHPNLRLKGPSAQWLGGLNYTWASNRRSARQNLPTSQSVEMIPKTLAAGRRHLSVLAYRDLHQILILELVSFQDR